MKKLKIIQPECYKNYSLSAGITTRNGGISTGGYKSWNFGFNSGDDPENVIKNRELLYSHLNGSPEHFVYANQVHSDKIAVITQKERGIGAFSRDNALDGIDAMITQEKDIFLTIQTADCMSIFVFCPVSMSIGLVHAGWKGTELNAIGKTIEKMQEYFHAQPEKMIVYFGPSICRDCYEVGEEFQNIFRSDELGFKEGKIYLDLLRANKRNCQQQGIPEKNLFSDSFCTFRDHENFFSYRRDGAKTGRMISFFAIRSFFH